MFPQYRSFFEKIYAHEAVGDKDAAMDLLFDTIDDLLNDGGYDVVDWILDEVDLTCLSSTLIVGFLCTSNWAKDRLLTRFEFVKRAEARLNEMFPSDPRKVDDLMKGLRD